MGRMIHPKNSLKLFGVVSLRSAVRNSNKDLRFERHTNDSGSAEVQIARQTVRITELTEHLKQNKHDYATKRGLTMIIGKRLGLLRYLIRKDREKYLHVCIKLGLKKMPN